MLKSLKTKAVAILMLFAPLSLTSCTEDSANVINTILEILLSMLGWDPSTEHIENQENTVVIDDDEVKNLPDQADLSKFFPPIGDQGEYGTCVAWSSGYALKTALDAKSNGYTSSQLRNKSYQCSAVDLWHNIPSSGKSTSCNGSNFDPALQAMVDHGVASMAKVDFTNKKMTCDGVSGVGGSNKLYGFRVIAYSSEMTTDGSSQGMNVNNFKYYLDKGYPILIGARLGNNFMSWSSSSVLKSDTKTYNGQHAYHALVVTGYDDNKNAFRIRNSWGETMWGDNGCIWIDYSFFLKQFVFGAWIAYNKDQVPTSVSSYSSQLKAYSPNDLAAKVISDVQNADGTRTLAYDVVNKGTSDIDANKSWSVIYIAYKAKNLNDYTILFHDIYTADESANNGYAVYPSRNSASNVNIAAGSTVAKSLGGKRMEFNYKVPEDLNGEYYFALVVNPFNSIAEKDFANNVAFVSGRNSVPLTITDGKISNMPSELDTQYSLASTKAYRNTYTTDEIVEAMTRKQKNNKLETKVKPESNVALRSSAQVKRIVR